MITMSFEGVTGRDPVEQELQTGGSQPRVLIVDDDHSSVQIVYGMAKSFEAQVDAANGGEAAIKCLEKLRYNAVITNLELHGLSGYELACWVRDKSPGTGIIIITGRDQSEIEPYMKTDIADHWIFKPFGSKDLGVALDRFVSKDTADLR